jgi:hypothetical protein
MHLYCIQLIQKCIFLHWGQLEPEEQEKRGQEKKAEKENEIKEKVYCIELYTHNWKCEC